MIYLQTIDSTAQRSKFETIYRTYRNYMYRAAVSILKNPQDAEDAVQTAFVCIAENIRKIPEADSPKTKGYILTVVRSKAIDLYRKKQAHPQGEYNDTVPGVQKSYDGDNQLAGCMLKLPERQRTVLILKYYHGYELKEIAKMLNISYQNALKIEQRAKEKLHSLCREEGIKC